MSGHVGLREDARQGHLLARRIARLFAVQRGLDKPQYKDCRNAGKSFAPGAGWENKQSVNSL